MTYSMWSGPTYSGTRQEFFDSAMSQPLSLTSTFFDQAKGGALESFGLGTVLRGSQVPLPAPSQDAPYGFDPSGLDVPQGISPQDYLQGGWVTPGMIDKKRQEMGALTEDQYKASPSYRKDIPYDPGMTGMRASALASMDDAKKVREFYAQKRPISAFLGSMAGQALDPVNYVPVFGEAVTAAAIGRFGYIGGRALVAGADAALNTGIAGAVTAGERGKFGDDVSWQGLISQMATAALIGTAFGTLHGVFGKAPVDPRVRAEAETRLSTLRTVQESRIALNEGLDAVANGEDIKLSPNSTEPMARVAGELQRITPSAEPPDELDAVISKASAFSDPIQVARMAKEDQAGTYDALSSLRVDVKNAEKGLMAKYGVKKLADLEDAPLTAKEQQFLYYGDHPTGAEQINDRVDMIQPVENKAEAVSELRTALQKLPDETDFDRLSETEKNAVGRVSYLAGEIERLGENPMEMIKQAMDEYATKFKDPEDAAYMVRNVLERLRGFMDAPARQSPEAPARAAIAAPRAIDTTAARPEPAPEGIKQAEAAIAKPDDSKAMAAQYRVDPQTGSFHEEADLAQLAAEGRFTEHDAATMVQAQADFETGSAFAEALKSVAGCLI